MEKSKEDWIKRYLDFYDGKVLGKCQSAVKEMNEVFPELKPVVGWCSGFEHHWLVDVDGTVVDPTASQFYEFYGLPGELVYKEWKPGDRTRVGRCMNCGEDIYKNVQTLNGKREDFCDDDCYFDYAKYCT